MKSPQVGKYLLQARLMLARFGVVNALATSLCVAGATCWLWILPEQEAAGRVEQALLEKRKLALLQAPAAPKAIPVSPAQANLTAFYATLGTRQAAVEQVRTLFVLAHEAGLSLDKGEYKSAYNVNSRSHAYQVLLPVTGTYSAIRLFCEKVLVAIPFASLDEIGFKREAVAAGALQAKLRFTLHLGDPPALKSQMELYSMLEIVP
jgi:hypothetical protein